MREVPANVVNLPLEERAEMALKAAVRKFIVNTLASDYQFISGGMAKSWKSPPDELRAQAMLMHAEFIEKTIAFVVARPFV